MKFLLTFFNRRFGIDLRNARRDELDQEFSRRVTETENVLRSVVEHYANAACPCAFPRFRQLAALNCTDTGHSFKCMETELLIEMSSVYFREEESAAGNEVLNKRRVCLVCGSIYEYGWSDLNSVLDRQFLKVTSLKASTLGSGPLEPVPVYLGPVGHSIPENVFYDNTLEALRDYLLEPAAETTSSSA
jgi:hypothetical protein